MYLDGLFGLSLSLSEITLLFDLSLDLDRKAKSEVRVTQCRSMWIDTYVVEYCVAFKEYGFINRVLYLSHLEPPTARVKSSSGNITW